jgi:hypothetical protein
MKKNIIIFCLIIQAAIVPLCVKAQDATGIFNEGTERVFASHSNLFRKNMGQWDHLTNKEDPKILFRGTAPGWNANVYFMQDHLSYGFMKEKKEVKEDNKLHKHGASPINDEYEYMTWNMYFKGANTTAHITTEGEENSHTNYMIGNDIAKHASNVPDYKKITYNNLYRNIDIVYYQTEKNLKYDYMLKPGGSITDIQHQCEGVNKIRINSKGQLEISTPWGILVEALPESYQLINGNKKQVGVSYRLIDNTTWGYAINGRYDAEQTLIIDPVMLVWSTFVGGTLSTGNGYLYEHKLDVQGNIYGTGFYNSSFPTTAGVYSQTPFNAGLDAFVFKLNRSGASLIYATYVGGTNGGTEARGIDINLSGETFVTGYTQATNFPLVTPFTASNSGNDVIVFKLNATGTALLYSTYIGSGKGNAIDVNNSTGAISITGYTGSAAYPVTAGAYDLSYNGGTFGPADAFVTVINAGGASLLYSTFLGGSVDDYGHDIVIDATGIIYITGMSTSSAFPVTANAYDNTYNGGPFYGDAFVTKIDPFAAGNASLLYSTFIGGSGGSWPDDVGQGIALDPFGSVVVIGYTSCTTFAPVTAGAYQTAVKGIYDIFICSMDLTKSGNASMKYCTLLGGTGWEYNSWVNQSGADITTNKKGEIYISGNSNSTDFPMVCAYDNTFNGQYDIVVCKLDPTLSMLLYSTYFGGATANDYFPAITLWEDGCSEEVIVTGTSHSTDFPITAGAFQQTKYNGGNDQPFVFKLKPVITPDLIYLATVCNSPVNFTDNSTGNCVWQSTAWTASSWNWDFGDGTTSTLQNPTHIYSSAGNYTVKLVVGCPRDSITKTITVTGTCCALSAQYIKGTANCVGCGCKQWIMVTASNGTTPYSYSWPSGYGKRYQNKLCPDTYTIKVTDKNGCSVNLAVNAP